MSHERNDQGRWPKQLLDALEAIIKGIDSTDLIEAAYLGPGFFRFMGQRVNRRLASLRCTLRQEGNRWVAYRLHPTSLKETEEKYPIDLADVTGAAQWFDHYTAIVRSLEERGDRTNLDHSRQDDGHLIGFCETYLSPVVRAIRALPELQSVADGMSIGFHALRPRSASGDPDTEYLRYYFASGWQLHQKVAEELQRKGLQDVIKAGLGADLLLPAVEEPGEPRQTLLNLLLSGEWQQNREFGIYPKLLSEGSEILSEDFSVTPAEPPDAQSEDSDQWKIVTTLESIFLSGNGALNEPLKTYMLARPVFFHGRCLGDFFVAGCYEQNQRDAIQDLLRADPPERAPLFRVANLLEREVTFLLRFVDVMHRMHLVAGHEGTRRELKQLLQRPGPRGGGNEGAEPHHESIRTQVQEAFVDTFLPVKQTIQRRVLVHARQSAAAAIMVESYAHNISSHALEGVKGFFLPVAATSAALVFDPRACLPDFLEYLQGKSAFWNASARGGRLYGGEIRSLHEVIEAFARNRLFCAGLVASERLHGIKFVVTRGTNGSSWIFHSGEAEPEAKLPPWGESWRNDEVFLPEGVVGIQALYTIFENAIRNVKHCTLPADMWLPFHVEVGEEDGDRLRLTCWLDLDPTANQGLEAGLKRMKNWEGILLDELGAPNLGGTSQNVLCAGLLAGASFSEAEEAQRGSGCHPIEFGKEGNRLRYTVRLWKGMELAQWSDVKPRVERETLPREGEPSLQLAPPGRFRIIVCTNGADAAEFLGRSDNVRHVVSQRETAFPDAYENWVGSFVFDRDIHPNGLTFAVDRWEHGVVWRNGACLRVQDSLWFCLYHGERTYRGKIGLPYNADGVFGRLGRVGEPTKTECGELAEILGVTIDLIDDRLANRHELMSEEERSRLSQLFVSVGRENDRFPTENARHFLVVHLSRLERETAKRNADAIAGFAKQYSSTWHRYRFVVVTSGRGRDCLAGLDEALRQKTRFMPIENLERCFSEASRLNRASPALGLKYGLVKTLLGS